MGKKERFKPKVALMGQLVGMTARRRKLLGGFIERLACKVRSDPSYASLSDNDKADIETALNDLRNFCNFEAKGQKYERHARPEGRAA
jgi:hypothetical protein